MLDNRVWDGKLMAHVHSVVAHSLPSDMVEWTQERLGGSKIADLTARQDLQVEAFDQLTRNLDSCVSPRQFATQAACTVAEAQ